MCGTAVLAGAALMLGTPVLPAGAAVTGAAWQIQSSPNRTVPGGDIEGVSCPSVGACMAVGGYLNSAGLDVTLAESWNGTSWSLQHPPSPAGAPVAQFRGVSCPSAGFCEAVGSTNNLGASPGAGLAESWNPSGWSAQSVPAPAGATEAEFMGVSCVSATFCEAVGDYTNAAGTDVSLAEGWNGTSWAVQPVPLPAGGPGIDRLDAVSCTAADFCVAVDFYSNTAEMWNGTAWTAEQVPAPAGADSPGFEGVSCASASFCEAVGVWDDPTVSPAGRLLADAWNGKSWRRQPDPKLADITANLLSVSCTAAQSCEAVGYREVYVSGVDTFHAIAESWDGSSWRIQPTTSPGGTAPTILNGISCPSAGACTAGGGSPVWTEAWNGTAWQTQAAARPRGAENNSLSGVSCVFAGFCAAVGAAIGRGLPEGWDGRSWRIQPGTLPNALSGVSCVSADFCEAVGTGTVALRAAATWDGTSWQVQATPGSAYDSVSCTAKNFCQAVGPSGAALWNGTAWSAETIPFPGSLASGAAYTGVSCASASACAAVGARTSSGASFAASWNGTSWALQTVPSPSGATTAVLLRVSCAAADDCEAVGNADPGGGYAAVWNGTTWAVQPVPAPTGMRATLTGVSCAAADTCTAVGEVSQASPPGQVTLVETWNGTSWAIQPTPNPNPAHDVLEGVSCSAPGDCTAVGFAPDPGGISATLAESSG